MQTTFVVDFDFFDKGVLGMTGLVNIRIGGLFSPVNSLAESFIKAERCID